MEVYFGDIAELRSKISARWLSSIYEFNLTFSNLYKASIVLSL